MTINYLGRGPEENGKKKLEFFCRQLPTFFPENELEFLSLVGYPIDMEMVPLRYIFSLFIIKNLFIVRLRFAFHNYLPH